MIWKRPWFQPLLEYTELTNFRGCSWQLLCSDFITEEKSAKKGASKADFLFYSNYSQCAPTHLHLSPTTNPCILTCSFPEQKLVWLFILQEYPQLSDYRTPAGMCKVPPKPVHSVSAWPHSLLLLHPLSAPDAPGDNCFYLLMPWKHCSCQPLLQAGTLPSSWLAVAVTIYLLTV